MKKQLPARGLIKGSYLSLPELKQLLSTQPSIRLVFHKLIDCIFLWSDGGHDINIGHRILRAQQQPLNMVLVLGLRDSSRISVKD